MTGLLTNAPNTYVLMTDISEYQEGADLDAHHAAGYDLLSLRCQFGGVRLDRQFANFATAAKDAGMKRLYYVWVYPGSSIAQHAALMRQAVQIGGLPELGFMLDVEDTTNTLGVDTYAALVEGVRAEAVALTGVQPVIYTSAWYWDVHLRGIEQFADCPLIVAAYPFQSTTGADLKLQPDDNREYGNWAFATGDRGQQAVPRTGGWDTYQAWQFTSVAGLLVPGFAHRGKRGLDLNLVRPEWVRDRLRGTDQETILPEADEMAYYLATVRLPDNTLAGAAFRVGCDNGGVPRDLVWITEDKAPRVASLPAKELSLAEVAACSVDRVPFGDHAFQAATGRDWAAWDFLNAGHLPGPPGPVGPAGAAGAPGATVDEVVAEINARGLKVA